LGLIRLTFKKALGPTRPCLKSIGAHLALFEKQLGLTSLTFKKALGLTWPSFKKRFWGGRQGHTDVKVGWRLQVVAVQCVPRFAGRDVTLKTAVGRLSVRKACTC
jgi:hypothetical protein